MYPHLSQLQWPISVLSVYGTRRCSPHSKFLQHSKHYPENTTAPEEKNMKQTAYCKATDTDYP